MKSPRSLTARLVLTAVALVAAVSVLVGGVTAIAMRDYLTGQLDDDVNRALVRAQQGPPPYFGIDRQERPAIPQNPDGAPRGEPRQIRGQSVGTVTAYYYAEYGKGVGEVITESQPGSATAETLPDTAMVALDGVRADGEPHEVVVPGLGDYRVAATVGPYGDKVAVGLPTEDVDDSIASLVKVELLLALLGVVAAASVGFAIVRRQLRPLREVAQTAHSVAGLPLASGEIGLTERVPPHLTDERTEVGQVGAALNTLLAHVETSLDARHRSEQRVRQFVADASHELRTPLTTIAGYTELARRRPDDVQASATALAKVEEESARMTALVEDLLLLARLDSGRPLERTQVDLTRLLLEAVSDARVVSPEHHWRLDLPDAAIEVPGDGQRLHQVVTNLLTNARKYTPSGTTITVTARADGFSVHDDGPGFPPDLVDHAFERFARGDVARHREGGVGLGLSLVHAIVGAHGGSVSLTSVVGDTRIDVTLPR